MARGRVSDSRTDSVCVFVTCSQHMQLRPCLFVWLCADPAHMPAALVASGRVQPWTTGGAGGSCLSGGEVVPTGVVVGNIVGSSCNPEGAKIGQCCVKSSNQQLLCRCTGSSLSRPTSTLVQKTTTSNVCALAWRVFACCQFVLPLFYTQAQRTVKWEVQDVQQQLHGSSSSSSTGRRSSSATSFSGEQRAAGAAANVGGSASSAVQCLTQPVAQAAAAADGVVALTVQPFVSVVPCLRDCPAQVYVASAYPQQLTEAVLSAVQLQQRTTVAAAGSSAGGGGGVKQQQQQPVVQVLYGSTLQQCLQQLQHQQQQQQPQQQQHQQQLVGGSIANGGSSSISSRHDVSVGVHQSQSQLLVLLSSPSRRPQKHQQPHHHHHLQDTQHSDDDTAASATQEETSCLPPPSQQQPPAAQQPAQPPRMQVQVAEWACKAPSLRARSLSTEGLGLLSEWGLAELLGVDSSDAVMDGIAWRRS